MPLYKLNEDYKGWKAGVTVRLCSQDHLEAMGRGIGIEVQEPKPKSKVKVKIESIDNATAKVAKANEVIEAIKKPEISKEKSEPEIKKQPAPTKTQSFNTRDHKKKVTGKKRKE